MFNNLSRIARILFILDAALIALLGFLGWIFVPYVQLALPMPIDSASTQIAAISTATVGSTNPIAVDQGETLPQLFGNSALWAIFAGALVTASSMSVAWRQIKQKLTLFESVDQSVQSAPSHLADPALPVFPNYMQLRTRSRIPHQWWAWMRIGTIIGLLVFAGILFVAPANGLFLWWRLTVPLLPFVFLFAPGLWRNVCPLAASNQIPRQFNFSRALTPPGWLKEYGFVIGVIAFFALASSRKWLFNTNGPATGLLLLAAIVSALLGGYLFKGKSGWCSSICPLYPVQRLYNRTPFVTIANAHCTPCVGCTKNCYDFNPGSAYLADLHDDDKRYANYRKFFAAAMPGFIAAYFTVPDPHSLESAFIMYIKFALYIAASVGVFSLLDTFWHGATNKITVIYGASAFNLFYWFGLPSWVNAIGSTVDITPPDWLPHSMQIIMLGFTVVWLARSFRREGLFLKEFKSNEELNLGSDVNRQTQAAITFMPTDVCVTADNARTILEIAEAHHQPIEGGCRAGMCGADPIVILDGADNLTPANDDEKNTLARLGLGPNCRLACMSRIQGPVKVLLAPRQTIPSLPSSSPVVTLNHPQTVAPTTKVRLPPAVTFMPNQVQVPTTAGRTLLEIAESNKQPIAANCRMGVCGADPICILEGMENLAPMGSDEKSTLARLGLGPNCRLACMSRVKGPVTVSLNLDTAKASVPASAPAIDVAKTSIPASTPVIDAIKASIPASAPVIDVKPRPFEKAPLTKSITPALPSKQPEVVFMPDELHASVKLGQTLLEIAENNNQPIEAGCRMGVCGADPILILNGMENLNPVGNDEKNTLERLGLGSNCRLACMCRVKGTVTISLQTKAATAKGVAPKAVTEYDHKIKRVVIVGNGVAGVTAADYVRRYHPECEIHVISKERHHFYNRIGIMRLIYGRSAMSGLYLQPEAWYDERQIICWLNTHVTHINRGHKHVLLATGETLSYDRLILASGSSSFVPPIPGFGLPGTFVLRDAEGAMEIRAYVQQHHSKSAVIAGGGLLGLEAAYALHQLGLTVWVLERGDWLLRRQLDERGGQILKRRLEAMGLIIETRAETAAVEGEDCVSQVKLTSEQTLPCDVFLVAVGIQPNVELARRAGLKVNRGILVDETMQTNASGIFAAGDVCEFESQVPGLWPVAVEQAKVAAINALGGTAKYNPVVPVAMLKVVGVDVTSVGRFEAQFKTDTEIVIEDPDGQGYRKLVLAKSKLVGAILIGHPDDAPGVTAAIKAGLDVSDCLKALRAGEWHILGEKIG